MKAIEVKKDIYWVGAIDWKLRNFHGYLTQRGSTYNAYLIIDEKITLIDTVKGYLTKELLERISDVIDLKKIDYVVSNHVEMDHSGAMPEVMAMLPNATVITSIAGEKEHRLIYKKDWKFQTVKSGDIINIGKRNLHFVMTPMVHWPDNMVTYCPEEKILFSNDAFGEHIASSERFDDQFPVETIIEEAKKYYANIVLPYSSQVVGVMEIVRKLDLELICPSHGLVWRTHIPTILEMYEKWSSNKTDKKAVIVYDSMWDSTEKIAKIIKEAFEDKGYHYCIYDLKDTHISDIMTQIIEAEYICVGSPTLNKGILPTVAAFLTYLQGLAPKSRKAVLFGSYGWAQANMKELERYMEASNIEVIGKYNINFIPSKEQLDTILNDVKEKIC
ncbi:MAG: FprA family A-type flavoprotein [Bacteroidales bacterium]|nr:FprA family A-type flavoprotein [Bacteroidales bacterium]MDD4829221.1 FprA family A-type flavoprotein [Bacteroidales bacterium]